MYAASYGGGESYVEMFLATVDGCVVVLPV